MNEIDLHHDLRGGLLIIAVEHFVFPPHLIWSRLRGVLVLDFLQALQYQVQIALISAVGDGPCDAEASIAKKTRTGSQSLGIAVLVISASCRWMH
jgi:hypothetical protein